jgi:hypothetical protein
VEVQVPGIDAEPVCELAVGQMLALAGAQRFEHS